MPVLRGVPSISERRSINRAGTFLRAKGGVGLFFFAYTPDMQYFKRMLPPTFTVPLNNLCNNSCVCPERDYK